MKALMLILFWFMPHAIATTLPPCAAHLTANTELDDTDNFITYLSLLLEHRSISAEELNAFIENLNRGIIENPISKMRAQESSVALTHYNMIETHIAEAAIDREKLLKWARQTSSKNTEIHIKRDETRHKTKTLYQEIEFHTVSAATFPLEYETNYKIKPGMVTLTHTIAVMTTTVTQKQWVDLMGENPSWFTDDLAEQISILTAGGKTILMQPNHPVENVTWWSAIVFANKLSEKHGLEPAYDLSHTKFLKHTHAADGRLEAKHDSFRINAPAGDIYRAQGFRLPTRAEQAYMYVSALKQANDLKEHAWCSENSNHATSPVAQLIPWVINGGEIFDLCGNVTEWGHDYNGKAKSGENPLNRRINPQRVTRGGSCSCSTTDLQISKASPYNANNRFTQQGFRLVRTLDP